MKISKKITAFCAVLFLFVSGIYPQNTSLNIQDSEEPSSSLQNSGSDSSSAFQDDIPFTLSDSSAEETPARSNTFFLFFRMILVLAFVVACIYGVLWLMRRSMKRNPKNSDPFLRNVSSIDLAVGKSVHVVTLLDRAYVVGVGENSVNLLGEFSSENEKDRELINAMNLYADEHQNVKKPKSFADVLEIFMPKAAKSKSGIFGDTQKRMNDTIERQRNQMNGGDESE